VTVAGDGRAHGLTIDIIATAAEHPKGAKEVTVLGTVGKEMLISLNEAVRLVNILHPKGVKPLEISFSDKYTANDGGSGGTAFTLLMLSALGDFEINPDAAITGDITVDSKVRPIGEMAAKVHGAALDHCKLVAIPTDNAEEMDDAVMMNGPSVLWETQIFSIGTLDEAIAVMRKDPDAKLAQAMTMFDDLKADYAGKPVTALAEQGPREKLIQILDLAPNHVSARELQRFASGSGPTHLTLNGTLDEAVAAMGTMRSPLTTGIYHAEDASRRSLGLTLGALSRVRRIADPQGIPVIVAIASFCNAYADWAEQVGPSGDAREAKRLGPDLIAKHDAIGAAIRQVISDPQVIDRMIHP
jgi:hypothetical protein